MNTITKTHVATDITVAGAHLHEVPTIRWTIRTDEATAHLDVIAHTAIVGYHGDRRDVTTLLAHLTAMGFDLDVNEDDPHLEWMIGFDGAVWGVAPETIFDHCDAALAPYREPYPAA